MQCLTSIPVNIQPQDQNHLLELLDLQIFPFDTPLQIAYRFCNSISLDFALVSPLSKHIAQYIRMIIQSDQSDTTVKTSLLTHFQKFNNIFPDSNYPVTFSNNFITIFLQPQNEEGLQTQFFNHNSLSQYSQSAAISKNSTPKKQFFSQNESLEFSFVNSARQETKTPYFLNNPSKVKLLKQLLQKNPQHQAQKSQRIQQYLSDNTLNQMEHLQHYNNINNKIIQRLKRQSPNRKQSGQSYLEYKQKGQNSSIQRNRQWNKNSQANIQQNQTIQTLPKTKLGRDQDYQTNKKEEKNKSMDISFCNELNQSSSSRVIDQQGSKPRKNLRKITPKRIKNQIVDPKLDQKLNEIFNLMDIDKDGYIDPQRLGIEELKLNIRRQFESVWFNIILKRDLVNKDQFKQLMKQSQIGLKILKNRNQSNSYMGKQENEQKP